MKQQPSKSMRQEIRYTQNFLRDPALVAKLVEEAEIQSSEDVLEIGPGRGIITKALAQAVGSNGQVIAVELDHGLAIELDTQYKSLPQVKVIAGDILAFDLSSLPENYKVFANVPFNITSALLEYLFDTKVGPSVAHLILETDSLHSTGERGVPLETFKSLLVKPLYSISMQHQFKRSDFMPQPSVDTSLFRFEKRSAPLIDPDQYDRYKDFLAYVSKDRVGEGVWQRVFSKNQIQTLAAQGGIIVGRGLKMQSVDSIINAFRMFAQGNRTKFEIIRGAMDDLRNEQARREQINRSGGHRRPRRQ